MIITNEKKYIEDILKDGNKPTKMSVKSLIKYIAKYYYEKFKDEDLNSYVRYVLDAVGMMNLSLLEYQEYRFADFTKQYCKKLREYELPYELREVSEISFTEDEMNTVNSTVYRKDRKVLFTLYALAKIYSPELGWINCSDVDIFKYANVSVQYKERLKILHTLYSEGLIDINHMIDKSGYHVEMFPDSPVVFSTTTLTDFGKQYLDYMSEQIKKTLNSK